eukprot:CAMPEP_0116033774 /NCGR_PEP_ID=MMETSP0321-20121206/19196_1 /TAXON_ID=163516 /ORGANISM="Leptocylindrus danicus var. danicus, Strain B650" /LENGTH=114 /DNA_ID=CAMNT_0003509927 /DNA_START=139 /DNA_END=483 /DNA_ORIENTATION=-
MPPITRSVSANQTAKRNRISVGEELWEIHLARSGSTLEDSSDIAPRKRSRSVGEELWEVHLKRSEGHGLNDETEDALPDEGTVVHPSISSSAPNVVPISPDISALKCNSETKHI